MGNGRAVDKVDAICYADAFKRSIISGAIYHLPFYRGQQASSVHILVIDYIVITVLVTTALMIVR